LVGDEGVFSGFCCLEDCGLSEEVFFVSSFLICVVFSSFFFSSFLASVSFSGFFDWSWVLGSVFLAVAGCFSTFLDSDFLASDFSLILGVSVVFLGSSFLTSFDESFGLEVVVVGTGVCKG